MFSNKMADDGTLIIEDMQCWEWIGMLKIVVPEHLMFLIKIDYLRQNKNRHDDIVFSFYKSIE